MKGERVSTMSMSEVKRMSSGASYVRFGGSIKEDELITFKKLVFRKKINVIFQIK